MKSNELTPILKFENLVKEKFHPNIFTNFEDFKKFTKMNTAIGIDAYTDFEIKQAMPYKIFAFTNPVDYKNVPISADEYLTEIFVNYDEKGCFKGLFITGIQMDAIKYANMFYKDCAK